LTEQYKPIWVIVLDDKNVLVTPYDVCTLPLFAHIAAGLVGYGAGFVVFWLFYQVAAVAVVGGLFIIPVAVAMNIAAAKKRRKKRLLLQFQSLLESLVVSLQAGNTDLNAFKHAYEDMKLMYSERSDIAKETQLIVHKFSNRISIGEALADFAARCELDDIKLFSAVYLSVEGKGDKTREIVLRTQKVLSDKIAIQMEIQTMSSGAVMEINIIAVIPILIVAVMGFMGGELMEGLFTPAGRVIATVALFIFIGSYALGRTMTNIKI
jgi:tight adherence protein B